MGVYLPYTRLPSEYQEVEYIESSGTQRIDTGLKPTDATFGFKGKVNMTELSGDWILIGLTGVLDSWSSQHYMYGIGGYASQWQTCNIMTYTSGWANSGSISLNTPYEFTFNYNSDRKLTVNGSDVKTGLTSDSYSYSKNWNLFCQTIDSNLYSSATYRRYASCKLYYFQIYKGTTLLRDFIPCYRKSDGVIGLYDLVNSVFYTNSGTGSFSKGNDVTMVEMKNAYIGEVWTPGSNTIAYLPLKENSNDLSGNGNNGTDTNITYSNGKAVFNNSGTSNIVINGISGSQRTFTIHQIIQVTDNGQWQVFFMQSYYSGGTKTNSGGQWASGNIMLLSSSGSVDTGYTMDNNEHLYSFVVDTGTIKCYVDGDLKYTWSTTVGSYSSAKFILGNRPNYNDNGLRGTMREVIVESALRTDAEILELAQVYGFAS